jgi:hypothetical protein
MWCGIRISSFMLNMINLGVKDANWFSYFDTTPIGSGCVMVRNAGNKKHDKTSSMLIPLPAAYPHS